MNKYLNYSGLIFVIVILIPNIVFAITCKDGFENRYQNKLVESLEQIGRFGCFFSMFLTVEKLSLAEGIVKIVHVDEMGNVTTIIECTPDNCVDTMRTVSSSRNIISSVHIGVFKRQDMFNRE